MTAGDIHGIESKLKNVIVRISERVALKMRTSLLNKANDLLTPAFENNVAGKESILRALAYFDIFCYPLTKEEVAKFMNQPADNRRVEECLSELLNEGTVFLHQEFYSLQDNPLAIHRRKEGQQRAEQLLKKAMKIGRFLYQFPFVRGVAVSGSLSKNFAEENADIDFFIITKANRLWLARTFMHLFKKLTFLTGRQHYYCMNYYIDEEALLLEDKNIFTAVELKTVLPVRGENTMAHFFATNQWANEWLPNCGYKKQTQKDPKRTVFKNVFEWLLDNRVGNALDKYLFRLISRRWKNKIDRQTINYKGVMMGMVTGRHYAKSNPGNLQAKVLQQYEEKTAKVLGIPYSPLTVSSVK